MKKALRFVGWIVWAVALLFLLFTAFGVDDETGIGIGLLVLYLFFSLIFFLVGRSRKKRKGEKATQAERVAAGALPAANGTVRHVAGLPVPAGAPCSLEVYVDRLYIDGGGRTFELPMSRVVDAQLYEDTEMRHYVESSVFQTMLGGAAFGATGAIIGAMPESKYRREIAKYNLMVSYVREDKSPKALVFTSDTSLSWLGASIQQYHKGSRPVETTKL